jgi:RHS repeat-associated protein
VLGCRGGTEAVAPEIDLVKLTPTSLSNEPAWALFDHDTTNGFAPTNDPIEIAFDRDQSVVALRVFGSSPYRVSVTDKSGVPLGFEPIDLSQLGAGWHEFPSTLASPQRAVVLRFEALAAPTSVPEVELWSEGERITSSVGAWPVGDGLAATASSNTNVVLSRSLCAAFPIALSRPPSVFRRGYLVYETEGALRSFELKRSVNGGLAQGGSWLGGDPAARTHVDRVDLAELRRGANEVVLCASDDATRDVTVSNLRFVGELDQGATLIDAVTVDGHASQALSDGDRATSAEIAAHAPVVISFDRLIAPELVRLDGAQLQDVAAYCVDRGGARDAMTVKTAADARATFVQLNGAARSCARLALELDAAATISSVEVIGSGTAARVDWPHVVVTSAPEHFGDAAWVSGYTARPSAMTGAVRVEVAANRADSMTGSFGMLVRRSGDGAATWQVPVQAKFPDGTEQKTDVVLDHVASRPKVATPATAGSSVPVLTATPKTPVADEGDSVAVSIDPKRALAVTPIRLGTKVGLDVPAGAVAAPTKIVVRHLGEDVVPPLDPGMINVTAPRGHGFEFLPHGQRFAKPVEVIVPFDPRLIPEGMTVDDVHTFYFDPVATRWKKLERKAIDIGEGTLRSTTNHFTIMIDAVLTVPKNATPLSFDPTTLSGIAAASPAANIDFIDPPSPNSTGDARLALPIRLPRGRGAYSPALSIAYASGGGNGWLGVGWDLTISKIEIDTRWGVPDYAEIGPAHTHATEARYLLDGAELVPTLDSDGPGCSDGSAGRRYHTRIEGAFAHILRCGTGVADYHFEVHDRDGTLLVYGKETASDPSNANLASYETSAGIFRWQLARVTDVHRNTTKIFYQSDHDPGSADHSSPREPSRELYPERIEYTSHPLLAAAYAIDFVLDDGGRGDKIVSGRAGFKMVTRHLLRAIRVRFGTEIIRQYVLTYAHGQFDKSVLANVRVFGLGGCAQGGSAYATPACPSETLFHEHRFDYFSEPEAFDSAEPWDRVNDPNGDTGALNRGSTTAFAGGLTLSGGSPGDPTRVSASLGANLHTRAERLGTYDLDGDGLVDQLIETDDGIVVLHNDAANHRLVRTTQDVTGLGGLGRERGFGWNLGVGVQGQFGGVGASFSNATTRADRFVTDLDGDGFLDVVRSDGRALFGRRCPSGTCFEDQPFAATTGVDPAQDPLLQQYQNEIGDRLFPGAAVRRWVAPFSGEVTADATVSKQGIVGTKVVSVGLHHQDALLHGVSFGPLAATEIVLSGSVRVEEGESLYLVVSTADDPAPTEGTVADEIASRMVVRYTKTCTTGFVCADVTAFADTAHDPTGAPVFVFDSSNDFRVAGSPAPFIAAIGGRIALHGELSKQPTSAPVRACIQKYTPGTPRNELETPCSVASRRVGDEIFLAADERSVVPLEVEIPVEAGEQIVLRVEADYSFDPNHVLFVPSFGRPMIEYVEADLPDDNGNTVREHRADVLAQLPIDTSTFWVYPVLPTPPASGAPMPFIAPRGGTLHVGALEGTPGDTSFELGIRSDRLGVIAIVPCTESGCLSPLPDIEVLAGDSVTFETRAVFPEQLSVHSIEVSYDHVEVFHAPLVKRARFFTPHPPTPFVGGYRSWHATLWNQNEPFAPTQLIADYADPADLSDDRKLQIMRSTVLPNPGQLGADFTGLEPAWIGPGSHAFVSTSRMNAGRVGLSFAGLGTADLFAGDYVRLSGSRSFGVNANLTADPFSLGLSVTGSQTDTTTDVVDLNGDGIADVISGDRTTPGVLKVIAPIPSLFGAFKFGDGFRKRKAFDYSIQFDGSAVLRQTTAGGRTVAETATGDPHTTGIINKHGVGLAVGRSQTTEDLADVNGDGLPDKVRRRGRSVFVQYNLGDHYGIEEAFGTVGDELAGPIDGFTSFENSVPVPLLGGTLSTTDDSLSHDTTITQHSVGSLDFIVAKASKTTRRTSSRTTRQLADLNGDGLPDLLHKRSDEDVIHVQFNRGGDFGPPTTWNVAGEWPVGLTEDFDSDFTVLFNRVTGLTGADVLAGTGSITGTTYSASFDIPIVPGVVSLGGQESLSFDTDTYELALLDIDGDGAADHVLRRRAPNTPQADIFVKHNRVTGKANLLRSVSRPLGGTITLDYARSTNTIAMPQSRELLTRVDVDDRGTDPVGFETPVITTTIAYSGGVYDRHEKEFFGFSTVTATRADGVRVKTSYNTTSYALHGRVVSEERRDGDGNLFSRRDVTLREEPVRGDDDLAIPFDLQCLVHKHPLLPDLACLPAHVFADQEVHTRAEGGTLAKTRTMTDHGRDRFGNVLASTDTGDDAIATDDVFAQASYHNDPSRWILGRATSLEGRTGDASGTLLRARTGDYDTFGRLTAVHIQTGSPLGVATTQLSYDAFGNLVRVTTPPNETGQSQTVDVTFDPTCRSYPVEVTDGFGYKATAEYDLRFGVAILDKDINDAELRRTLDVFGRPTAVRGPYDSGAPGLVMDYRPNESPPRAITTTTPSAPPDYTGTVPPPTTAVTFLDGLGRMRAIKKSAVVDVQGIATLGAITSGITKRDAMGRVAASYHPFFTPGASTTFTLPAITPLATTMVYDALDRQTLLTHPDGATEAMTFSLATAPGGALLFQSQAIDPNGHARETFVDHLGRTRAFVEHPTTSSSSVTAYDYLATGELSRIVDAEGNVSTLGYDLRGLRTALQNPDTGLIEEAFDLLGNRISLTEPNHRALGVKVRYRYDLDRLTDIDYPSKPDVKFTFGAAGAPVGDRGRLLQVIDESGRQEHHYGALGELRQTVRKLPEKNDSELVFDLRLTSDSLGRQLRVVYPDGEVVTNEFDEAGMLSRITGAGTGWSRVYAQDLQYDKFGHRVQIRLGNGVLTRMEFDEPRARLSSITTTLPSQTKIQDLHFTYDPASNPLQIANTLPALSGGSSTQPGPSTLILTYDGVDRLITSTGQAQLTQNKTTNYLQQFAYSASHNLLHKERTHTISQQGGPPAAPPATNFSSDYTYAPGRPHLPRQIGSLVVTYDPSGNPLTRTQSGTGSVQALVWDDDNRLVDFTGNGVHQHNTFDAGGNRVRRKSTQSETVFSSQFFDLENGTQGVKHVFAGSTRVASELTKFASGTSPIAPDKPGIAYFFHADHLGSTGVLTDQIGAVYQSLEYFSDGETWIDRGPAKPVNGYLFNGKPFDPDTGFYDFGQRFYDPRTSLWLGLDSVVKQTPYATVGRPGEFAPIAYAANSPQANIDPDGREPWMNQAKAEWREIYTNPEVYKDAAGETAAILGALIAAGVLATNPELIPFAAKGVAIGGVVTAKDEGEAVAALALGGFSSLTGSTLRGGVALARDAAEPGALQNLLKAGSDAKLAQQCRCTPTIRTLTDAELAGVRGTGPPKPTDLYHPTQPRSKFDFAKVDQYAQEMKAGRWNWNSKLEKIIIDPNGNILSGHHRVLAAEKAGVTIPESAIYRTKSHAITVYKWEDILTP